MTTLRPGPQSRDRTLDQIVGYARRVEERGFPRHLGHQLAGPRPADPRPAQRAGGALGRDQAGRARHFGAAGAAAPPGGARALRARRLQALSGGRLRLGVGSGSTKADFDLLDADFGERFRTLMHSLEIMRRAWKGDPVKGGVLSPWPGCEGGPPIVLGAWRNRRWITYAATECYGWTASGHYSSWEDLERGMRIYREAGGGNAILANVAIDLAERPETGNLGEVAQVSLIGPSDEVRRRLKRIEQIGFDEILAVSRRGPRRYERVRDFL